MFFELNTSKCSWEVAGLPGAIPWALWGEGQVWEGLKGKETGGTSTQSRFLIPAIEMVLSQFVK